MKSLKCLVILVEPQVVFIPGQVVKGQVLIDMVSDKLIKGVKVTCVGVGNVHWSNSTGQNTVHYGAREIYMNSTLFVCGAGNEPGVMLCAGSHVFPFQFVLPPGVPASFENGNHFVRYYLKGAIDTLKKDAKADTEAVFNVGSVFDLNKVQIAPCPVHITDSKTVCCWCCESAPLQATLRLEKTGYVPGETIVCNAEIINGTRRAVVSSKLRLMIIITCFDLKGHTTRHDRDICRLQRGRIPAGGTDVYRGEKLPIPPLPVSHLPGCNIIDVAYVLQLVIDVEATPIDLKLTTPIIIGTIPLRQTAKSDGAVVTNQPRSIAAPVRKTVLANRSSQYKIVL